MPWPQRDVTIIRRLFDTCFLTLGDMADRPNRSGRHFGKKGRVPRSWKFTCTNPAWKAVEVEAADQRPRRSAMVTNREKSSECFLSSPEQDPATAGE